MSIAEQEDAKDVAKQTAALVDHSTTHDFEDQRQYLTFLMQDEEYGVDILNVQEIRGWGKTSWPCSTCPPRTRA